MNVVCSQTVQSLSASFYEIRRRFALKQHIEGKLTQNLIRACSESIEEKKALKKILVLLSMKASKTVYQAVVQLFFSNPEVLEIIYHCSRRDYSEPKLIK